MFFTYELLNEGRYVCVFKCQISSFRERSSEVGKGRYVGMFLLGLLFLHFCQFGGEKSAIEIDSSILHRICWPFANHHLLLSSGGMV